ncbi:hypothetical protein [Pseudomonas sp. 31-12]|uniref:hypothetical protein n=1 Tax=Pseudomonas sp. 31-12 TaxID=2201356 RepID=UPI0013A53BC3|nr:hypothetical protein [Pseudomonas sp. 31-12]
MSTYLDVTDISFNEVEGASYDLAIFACGYEERSVFFPGMRSSKFGKVLLLGFSSSSTNEVFLLNKEFYRQNFSLSPIFLEYNDLNQIFKCLLGAFSEIEISEGKTVRIVVDYSSMPRLWYSEILNFIKCFDFGVPVACDFVYSVGEHSSSNVISQLSEPIVLPGCEAVSAYNRETIGIFSLGFSEGGPICLHHKIEPDRTFSLVARPGALDDYTDKTLSINKFFLDNFSNGTVFSPLTSVQQCYDTIREIFYPYINSAVVVIVPFGPKPHALASIVAAMNYPEVTCLYSSLGSTGCPVKPTTELVLSRILKLENSPYQKLS